MKIFLIGFMGSGKTHWGRLLSQKLGMPFFDLDEQLVETAGKSIAAIFASEGEEKFRLLEKETLHIISESHESFVMACGGGTPCFFNNIDYMNQSGTTVWINTTTEELFRRLSKEKDHRPLISTLQDAELRNYINRKFSDRRIFYEQAAVTMDDPPTSLEQLIDKIFHA